MNTLFPDEEMLPKIDRPKKTKNVSYEDFVAKFDHSAKKTTDDCYTPEAVYKAVLEWLREKVVLDGRPIVRPFYPGGDYEREEYPENCVVVDNPPFSILTKIVRFYVAHKIDFLLFAPTLTLFSTAFGCDITYITTNANIVYHNNANVHTSFVSSLFPGTRVILAGRLTQRIDAALGRVRKAKQKNLAPPLAVITAARLTRYVHALNAERDVALTGSELYPIRAYGKNRAALFGGGFLVSDAVVDTLNEIAPPQKRTKSAPN